MGHLTRHLWALFPEAPRRQAHGDEADGQGAKTFEPLPGRRFPLDASPGHAQGLYEGGGADRIGRQRSPFGRDLAGAAVTDARLADLDRTARGLVRILRDRRPLPNAGCIASQPMRGTGIEAGDAPETERSGPISVAIRAPDTTDAVAAIFARAGIALSISLTSGPFAHPGLRVQRLSRPWRRSLSHRRRLRRQPLSDGVHSGDVGAAGRAA